MSYVQLAMNERFNQTETLQKVDSDRMLKTVVGKFFASLFIVSLQQHVECHTRNRRTFKVFCQMSQ